MDIAAEQVYSPVWLQVSARRSHFAHKEIHSLFMQFLRKSWTNFLKFLYDKFNLFIIIKYVFLALIYKYEYLDKTLIIT